ncbi:MAG: hypothetical protein L0191_15075 [Acidobacteria bacterium]|nr:hypothetical protein [Acidobacteriota bacterium]
MDDVTALVERACTSIRELWNTYFYAGDGIACYPPEIQDLFEEIEVRLFGALVLSKLQRLASREKFRREPFPFLIVVPARDEVSLLIHRPATDGNRYWDAFDGRVGPTDVTLQFIEWFDWNCYDRRDFQYYLVNLAAFPRHTDFEGRDALIKRCDARVLFDASVR